MSQYVYPIQSGVRPWNGANVNLTAGEPWRADDPFVKAHRDLFAARPPVVRGTEPRVERATARPGERRG